MIEIDNTFLEKLGLGDLPLEEKDLLITQIYEQLQMRVGTRLADKMSKQQLEEFDSNYMQKDDKQGAVRWLEENFPDYPKVVQEEMQKLQNELKEQSDTIKSVVSEQAAANSQAANLDNPGQNQSQS